MQLPVASVVFLWNVACVAFAAEVSLVAASDTEEISLGVASALMLIAGISGPEEMCLVKVGAAAHLDACASAIAAGDGNLTEPQHA